jgi:type IV secretory pathway TrbF-like protein
MFQNSSKTFKACWQQDARNTGSPGSTSQPPGMPTILAHLVWKGEDMKALPLVVLVLVLAVSLVAATGEP